MLVVMLAFRKLYTAPSKMLEASHAIDSTRLEILWGVTHELSMQLRTMGPEFIPYADQMDEMLGREAPGVL